MTGERKKGVFIMMIPYLQTEFLNSSAVDPFKPAIIAGGGAIPFDHLLKATAAIEYDAQTARFTIKASGSFLINWFVAQQTGLCPEGSNFAIAVYNPILDETDPNYPGLMNPEIIVGSGHVKISSISGFAIIDVTDEQMNEGGVVFELRNTSNHDAALSERTQVKAGLAAFGTSNEMFKMAYGQWQASGWDKILNPYDLAHGEKIKFNESLLMPLGIVASDSDGGGGARIGYDIFTLENPGVYQVSWEIPIEATYSIDEVEIALELNGTTVYARSYSPLPIGVVSGTAIIVTTDVDMTLSLVNYQPDAADIIQIGNYANIAIHQIS